MCLILFAYQCHPDYPLILLANRDEFYHRPTKSAHFWDENLTLLAGKDLQAGGTWLGVTTSGRFAAVTNFREMKAKNPHFASRGKLPLNFLKSELSSRHFCENVQKESKQYDGYNLLVFDGEELWHVSNKSMQAMQISSGIFGVSNHLFDTPWPKVVAGKMALQQILQTSVNAENLFAVLDDKTPAEDHLLPDTGVGLPLERLLSARFIQSPSYGTRSSTVVLWHRNQSIQFQEKTFGPHGEFVDVVNATIALNNS